MDKVLSRIINENRRTSSRYGPYELGYTRVTRIITISGYIERFIK